SQKRSCSESHRPGDDRRSRAVVVSEGTENARPHRVPLLRGMEGDGQYRRPDRGANVTEILDRVPQVEKLRPRLALEAHHREDHLLKAVVLAVQVADAVLEIAARDFRLLQGFANGLCESFAAQRVHRLDRRGLVSEPRTEYFERHARSRRRASGW